MRSTVIKDNIPEELKKLPQWVCWKDAEGMRKVPLNPRTLNFAKTNTRETWGTFEEALGQYMSGRVDGIGFVFTPDDPYVGIDIDKCLDEGDERVPFYLRMIKSYTEISPSNNGLHIIFRGDIPRSGKDQFKCEVYKAGRYFTMTGLIYNGRGEIEDGKWDFM